jgi:hypothetical protein
MMVSSLSSIGTASQRTPNTDALARITDLTTRPNEPIGTSGALQGQGMPAAWNLYVAAARFVTKKIESRSSLDALAEELAEQINRGDNLDPRWLRTCYHRTARQRQSGKPGKANSPY